MSNHNRPPVYLVILANAFLCTAILQLDLVLIDDGIAHKLMLLDRLVVDLAADCSVPDAINQLVSSDWLLPCLCARWLPR